MSTSKDFMTNVGKVFIVGTILVALLNIQRLAIDESWKNATGTTRAEIEQMKKDCEETLPRNLSCYPELVIRSPEETDDWRK